MSTEMSQVTCIGLPQPKSWQDYREGCLRTFAGGHRSDGMLDAYQHGMETVFNLLEGEFPPAPLCKASPELLEACQHAAAVVCNHPDGHHQTFQRVLDKLLAVIQKAEGRS